MEQPTSIRLSTETKKDLKNLSEGFGTTINDFLGALLDSFYCRLDRTRTDHDIPGALDSETMRAIINKDVKAISDQEFNEGLKNLRRFAKEKDFECHSWGKY